MGAKLPLTCPGCCGAWQAADALLVPGGADFTAQQAAAAGYFGAQGQALQAEAGSLDAAILSAPEQQVRSERAAGRPNQDNAMLPLPGASLLPQPCVPGLLLLPTASHAQLSASRMRMRVLLLTAVCWTAGDPQRWRHVCARGPAGPLRCSAGRHRQARRGGPALPRHCRAAGRV